MTITGATLSAKASAVSDLIRLKKQYGTALLLLPTLFSLFIATGGAPSPRLLLIFVLGAFLMRSAGCAINDIADRGFDSKVERTRGRPLPEGRLSVTEALVVFAVLSLLAFVLVVQLNRLTVMLSMVAILLAGAYPFVKRVSFFPQAFLGAAFGWGAVMAWAAATGTIGAPALLIFLGNVFWSTAYDTVYALMDLDDDIRAGVKSTAVFFGERVFTAVTLMYMAAFLTFALAGVFVRSGVEGGVGGLPDLGLIYYLGLATALVYLLRTVSDVRGAGIEMRREVAFAGFVANVRAGVVVLVAIIIDMNIL